MTIINVNGIVHSKSISALDHGLLYGYGLFETLRAYDGIPFCLEEHLKRLYDSAGKLNWTLPWEKQILVSEIKNTIAKMNDPNLYVRFTVTKGSEDVSPSYIIIARPYLNPLKCWKLMPVSLRRNSQSPLSSLKTLNYLESVLAKQEALDKGANEGLLLNENGAVAEGSMSNIFLMNVNGMLITPDPKAGILKGITRQIVLEMAQKHAIPYEERQVFPEELDVAEEIFCTNSLIEIMPVTQWNNRSVGNGSVGKMTKYFHEIYLQIVSRPILPQSSPSTQRGNVGKIGGS